MKSILLIEDSERDQKILLRYMKAAGYTNIIVVSKGYEALDIFKSHKPEIVICDTVLPGINGFEVCKKIKSISSIVTYIIVTTGLIDEVDAGKAREAGADDYVVKTSDCKALLDALEIACRDDR